MGRGFFTTVKQAERGSDTEDAQSPATRRLETARPTIQKQTEAEVKACAAPDTLLLVEHPHVLTVGRRATRASIFASEEELRARGVAVHESNRGGKLTYHGLGQLVGYPVINLSPAREDVHRYVRDIEEVLVRALSDFRIAAFASRGCRRPTAAGKVAAIGVTSPAG